MSNQTAPTISLARVSPARYGPKQLGLFATTDIRQCYTIAVEKPMLSIRAAEGQAAIAESHTKFFDSLSALSQPDLKRMKNLAYRYNDLQPSDQVKEFTTLARPAAETSKDFERLAVRTFFAYSFPRNEDARIHRLFGELCFLNHSCRPNAVLFWDSHAGEMILRALEPIDSGEEILVSYLTHPFQPKDARQAELRFDCQCHLCNSNSAVLEDAYNNLSNWWALLEHSHSVLLRNPLAVNFRNDDWNQLRAIARNMSPDNAPLAIAEEFCRVASDLQIAHINLARAYELVSAARLAWFLTHSSETGRDQFMGMAIVAKAKEIRVLLLCNGLLAERGPNLLRQLWCMTAGYPRRNEVFSSLLNQIGLEGKVEGDRMEIRMPL